MAPLKNHRKTAPGGFPVLLKYKKMNYKIKEVHISTIKVDDIVLCPDGNIRTVGPNNFKKGFMGVTLWGDSYRLGTIPVKKVIYLNN